MEASPDHGSQAGSRKHRRLNRSVPQLKRNAACTPCRTRKIRCDGVKPFCGACVRSFNYFARIQPDHERYQAGIQCVYDQQDGSPLGEEREMSERQDTEEVDMEGKVKSLERQVGE